MIHTSIHQMIHKKANLLFATLIFMLSFAANFNAAAQQNKPNLLIIHTDEHNYRTLGCYRKTMTDDQAFMWGKNTIVTTPNIDKIANEGALCTSYYAASPVCTPSRASFVSGLYPIATGSPNNDMPLNDNIITFGQILKDNGYATSYVGKWHLDGDAKPGFAPKRNFGFTDNRYMFNRGHWKGLDEDENGIHLLGNYNTKTEAFKFDTKTATEETFTTDFLFNKAMDIMERDKNQPFCLMVSIPDPHGGNEVRPPYDTMYTHMKFENPRTMDKDPELCPEWNNVDGKKNVAEELNQRAMAQYYGMVKCIDDNVGRILNYLKEKGLDKNTIVVFTSDHGDLMGEHKKHNKGLPYATSAGIPFIIRYPDKIAAGKKINTAYTTTDFAPTILGLMDIKGKKPVFHGVDASSAFLSKEKNITEDRITYITNAGSRWVAAVNSQYKLVLSPSDKPYLFDLKKDPDEVINFYNDASYKAIAQKFQKELLNMLKAYNDPILKKGKLIL